MRKRPKKRKTSSGTGLAATRTTKRNEEWYKVLLNGPTQFAGTASTSTTRALMFMSNLRMFRSTSQLHLRKWSAVMCGRWTLAKKIRSWNSLVHILSADKHCSEKLFVAVYVPSLHNGASNLHWAEESLTAGKWVINIFFVYRYDICGSVSCLGRSFKWWKKIFMSKRNSIQPTAAANYDGTVIGTNNFLHANVICSQQRYTSPNRHFHPKVMCSSWARRPMPVPCMWTYLSSVKWTHMWSVCCMDSCTLQFCHRELRLTFEKYILITLWLVSWVFCRGTSFTVARFSRIPHCFHIFHIYLAAKRSSLLTHIEWMKTKMKKKTER